ncbi:MAG: hypothetical protein JNM79_20370 [Burkholderiales bacterium]|nr:hypothetical protein [Burkholderiales bacterium]
MQRELRPGQGKHIGVRHGRMMREVGDFGFDTALMLEALRLAAAFTLGAAATLWLSAPARSVVLEPAGTAQVFAPAPGTDVEVAVPTPDTPQRDAHSDGGGH